MGNLKIILGFAGGMGANKESMGFVVFVRYTAPVNALGKPRGEEWDTDDCLSGSH